MEGHHLLQASRAHLRPDQNHSMEQQALTQCYQSAHDENWLVLLQSGGGGGGVRRDEHLYYHRLVVLGNLLSLVQQQHLQLHHHHQHHHLQRHSSHFQPLEMDQLMHWRQQKKEPSILQGPCL